MAKVTQMKPKQKKYSDEELAAQLAQVLTDLPDNFLMCRDVRHAWDLENDFFVEKNKHGGDEIRRILICLRCNTERVERYNQTKFGLDKKGNHYEYSEGYQIHGVPRGNKPSVIVQGEQYRRAMERVVKVARKKKTA